MAQKLWEKNVKVDASIDLFTVGRDREMDLYLARYDILGSIAHITMLESIGLLTREELDKLTQELRNIYAIAEKGDFLIEDGVEDVHSQVELMLTRSLGDIGKKNTQRTQPQRPSTGRPEIVYPLGIAKCRRTYRQSLHDTYCPKREIQKRTDAGLYALASSHAVIIRTLVRRLCRKPRR